MKYDAILLGLVLTVGAAAMGAEAGAGDALEGKRFLSVEKLPGGERRDGTVNLIQWEIIFKEKSYTWRHHDVISLGKYEFDAKTGVLTVGDGDRKIEASFDAEAGVLTWEKQKYKVVKSEK